MTYATLAALFVAATAVVAGLVSWRRRLGRAREVQQEDRGREYVHLARSLPM